MGSSSSLYKKPVCSNQNIVSGAKSSWQCKILSHHVVESDTSFPDDHHNVRVDSPMGLEQGDVEVSDSPLPCLGLNPQIAQISKVPTPQGQSLNLQDQNISNTAAPKMVKVRIWNTTLV